MRAVDQPRPLSVTGFPALARPAVTDGPLGVGTGVGTGVGVGAGVGGGVGAAVGAGVGAGGGGGGSVRTGAGVGALVGAGAATSVGVGVGVGLGVGLGEVVWLDGAGVTSIPVVKPNRGRRANAEGFGVPVAAGRGTGESTTIRLG